MQLSLPSTGLPGCGARGGAGTPHSSVGTFAAEISLPILFFSTYKRKFIEKVTEAKEGPLERKVKVTRLGDEEGRGKGAVCSQEAIHWIATCG